MIYITGDCHANWTKFSKPVFQDQMKMSRDDYVIVCGDFGIWNDDAEERWWFDWMSKKPFTILFVDGNHENFDRLYSDEFEVLDFKGGKVHRIRDNVLHLMRGYVFSICGKKIFTFGGARSHDIFNGILDRNDFNNNEAFRQTIRRWKKQGKVFRVNHESWWGQELPNQKEMAFGLETLRQNNNKVDYIISHCCPQRIASIYSLGTFEPDVLTEYFDVIDNTVSFSKWYFGHYHNDISILDKYEMRYKKIERVV